ncbi:MAG: hypothetical protein ACOYI2_02625 [Bacillota bacterium]|jgi:hypothetical protein
MCIYAGLKMAAVRMIPVIDFDYRDKYVYFNKNENPGKAHLYY